MRIKDFTDTIRHLTDPFNIPEARRMIAENPALTQEQFKVGGLVEPGVTHYGKKDYRQLEPEFVERIKEKITLKPGQKWRFDKHTFGVPKGHSLYNKARYYGYKREKDIIRHAEYAKHPELVIRRKKVQKKRYDIHKKEILEKDREYRARKDVAKKRIIQQAEYAASPHGSSVRKAYRSKQMAEVGVFPSGNNYNENVWRDLFRSSQKKGQERFIWVDENGKRLSKKDYPKKDGKVNWSSDYKKVKFYDTKTKQFIKLDDSIKGKGISMEKYLNQKSVGGSGAYKGAIETYKNKDAYKSHEIMYQGKKQNLGTILRDKLFSPTDKKRSQFGKSAFHVAHPDINNQWWKSEVAFADANMNLEKLDKRLVRDMKLAKDTTAKNKVLANYAKKVEAEPGGITRIIEGVTYGLKPSESSVIAAGGQEANLMKSKNFRSLLNSRLKKTYAENQAQLFKNLGIKINKICSSLVAGGGRIGFAEGKVCGMDLVLANPEEFIKASQQDADFIKVLQKNPQRVKKVASKIARHALHPWSLLGGELWFVGLDTWASRTRGIPLNEALDNAFFFYDFGKGKENLMNVAADLGYSEDQIHGFNKLLSLAQTAQEIPKQEQVLRGYEQSLKGLTDPSPNISREKLAALAPGVAETGFADSLSTVQDQRDYISELEQQHQSEWDSYVWNTAKLTGKDVSQVTDEDLDIGFEGLYKTSEKKVREEIIEAGQERYEKKKRYVYPGSSDFGEALFTMWPGTPNWKERRRLKDLSEEELRQENLQRGYQPWEDVVGGEPLSPLHMKRLYGRGFGKTYDSLSKLFDPEHMAEGGIASLLKK